MIKCTCPTLGVLLALSLAACSSAPPAPVVERSNQPEVLAKPVDGLYRVLKGDNLAAIAFRYGLDYRDIAAWNGISAPWTIYPDQVLRLTPPTKTAASTTTRTQPAPAPRSETRQTAAPAAKPPPPASTTPAAPPPVTSAPQGSPVAPAVNPGKTDPESWRWPTQGRLLRTFSESDSSRNGIDIAAAEGQDVVASAAGQVVYSGNGLIGYGELVIIRHSEMMLSAYAHNSRRLVAEGEQVTAGQKIAEVGRNDRNETLLHFEIRRSGRPVNPLNYLPKQ